MKRKILKSGKSLISFVLIAMLMFSLFSMNVTAAKIQQAESGATQTVEDTGANKDIDDVSANKDVEPAGADGDLLHYNGGLVYFDNSAVNWDDQYIYFTLTQSNGYNAYLPMTKIEGTKLYVVEKASSCVGWSISGSCVVGSTTQKTTGKSAITDEDHYTGINTFYNFEDNKTYLIYAMDTNNDNSSPYETSYSTEFDGYKNLNYPATFGQKVSTDGTNYAVPSSSNSVASVTLTSKNLTGNTTTAGVNATTTTSDNTKKVGRTATSTLSYTGLKSGYKFVGWYDGSGKLVSTESTFTFYPTTAPTYYAHFQKSPTYYLVGGLVGTDSWEETEKSKIMSYDAVNKLHFRTVTDQSGEKYFRMHNGTTVYGNDNSENITLTKDVKTAIKVYTASENGAYRIANVTSPLTVFTDGTDIWYSESAYQAYTVTYGVNNQSMGTLTCTNDTTAVMSGDYVPNNTTLTFTAKPQSGYKVEGWYSNSACTSKIDGAGVSNTYTPTVTADTNVYVKYQSVTTTPTIVKPEKKGYHVVIGETIHQLNYNENKGKYYATVSVNVADGVTEIPFTFWSKTDTATTIQTANGYWLSGETSTTKTLSEAAKSGDKFYVGSPLNKGANTVYFIYDETANTLTTTTTQTTNKLYVDLVDHSNFKSYLNCTDGNYSTNFDEEHYIEASYTVSGGGTEKVKMTYDTDNLYGTRKGIFVGNFPDSVFAATSNITFTLKKNDSNVGSASYPATTKPTKAGQIFTYCSETNNITGWTSYNTYSAGTETRKEATLKDLKINLADKGTVPDGETDGSKKGNSQYIFFDNSATKWEQVYVYTWGTGGSTSRLPMTKIVTNDEDRQDQIKKYGHTIDVSDLWVMDFSEFFEGNVDSAKTWLKEQVFTSANPGFLFIDRGTDNSFGQNYSQSVDIADCIVREKGIDGTINSEPTSLTFSTTYLSEYYPCFLSERYINCTKKYTPGTAEAELPTDFKFRAYTNKFYDLLQVQTKTNIRLASVTVYVDMHDTPKNVYMDVASKCKETFGFDHITNRPLIRLGTSTVYSATFQLPFNYDAVDNKLSKYASPMFTFSKITADGTEYTLASKAQPTGKCANDDYGTGEVWLEKADLNPVAEVKNLEPVGSPIDLISTGTSLQDLLFAKSKLASKVIESIGANVDVSTTAVSDVASGYYRVFARKSKSCTSFYDIYLKYNNNGNDSHNDKFGYIGNDTNYYYYYLDVLQSINNSTTTEINDGNNIKKDTNSGSNITNGYYFTIDANGNVSGTSAKTISSVDASPTTVNVGGSVTLSASYSSVLGSSNYIFKSGDTVLGTSTTGSFEWVPTEAGTYTITYSATDRFGSDDYLTVTSTTTKTVTVTNSSSSTSKWYLRGPENSPFINWGTGLEMNVKGDIATRDVTIDAIDIYEFKITDGTNWFGHKNTNVTSGNCTDLDFSTSDGNPTIDASIAGTYTFTFNTTNKTLTVTYPTTQHTITIHYNEHGGTDGTETVNDGGTYTLPEPSAVTGYEFKGWYTESNFADSSKIITDSITVNSDIDIYAKWENAVYTVRLNTNDGAIAQGKDVTSYTYGTAVTLPTVTDVTKEGYTFGGWYDNAELSGSAVTQISATDTGAKTYYAKWTANKYTVTFNANEGSVDPATMQVTYDSEYGSLPTPTRENYTFDGWYLDAELTNPVTSTTIVSTDSNHNLYAKWTGKEITITLHPNYGTEPTTEIKVNYGSSYNLGTPERTGYTFAGWYTASTGGNQFETSGTVSITANTELFAHWTANTVTVTFDPNYSGAVTSTKDITFGGKYTLPATEPERTGYTFAGWYTRASGGDKVTADTDVTNAEAHTLYAHWTAIKYTVTASAGDGGTVSPTTITDDFGKTVTFTATPAEGKKVSAWKVNGETQSGQTSNTFEYTITAKETQTVSVEFTDIQYKTIYVGMISYLYKDHTGASNVISTPKYKVGTDTAVSLPSDYNDSSYNKVYFKPTGTWDKPQLFYVKEIKLDESDAGKTIQLYDGDNARGEAQTIEDGKFYVLYHYGSDTENNKNFHSVKLSIDDQYYSFKVSDSITGGSVAISGNDSADGTTYFAKASTTVTATATADTANGYNFSSWNLTGVSSPSETGSTVTFKVKENGAVVSAIFTNELFLTINTKAYVTFTYGDTKYDKQQVINITDDSQVKTYTIKFAIAEDDPVKFTGITVTGGNNPEINYSDKTATVTVTRGTTSIVVTPQVMSTASGITVNAYSDSGFTTPLDVFGKGTQSSTVFSGNIGSSVTLTAPTKEGYSFVGWYSADKKLISKSAKYTVPAQAFTGAMTLYALYEIATAENDFGVLSYSHSTYNLTSIKGSVNATPSVTTTGGHTGASQSTGVVTNNGTNDYTVYYADVDSETMSTYKAKLSASSNPENQAYKFSGWLQDGVTVVNGGTEQTLLFVFGDTATGGQTPFDQKNIVAVWVDALYDINIYYNYKEYNGNVVYQEGYKLSDSGKNATQITRKVTGIGRSTFLAHIDKFATDYAPIVNDVYYDYVFIYDKYDVKTTATTTTTGEIDYYAVADYTNTTAQQYSIVAGPNSGKFTVTYYKPDKTTVYGQNYGHYNWLARCTANEDVAPDGSKYFIWYTIADNGKVDVFLCTNKQNYFDLRLTGANANKSICLYIDNGDYDFGGKTLEQLAFETNVSVNGNEVTYTNVDTTTYLHFRVDVNCPTNYKIVNMGAIYYYAADSIGTDGSAAKSLPDDFDINMESGSYEVTEAGLIGAVKNGKFGTWHETSDHNAYVKPFNLTDFMNVDNQSILTVSLDNTKYYLYNMVFVGFVTYEDETGAQYTIVSQKYLGSIPTEYYSGNITT